MFWLYPVALKRLILLLCQVSSFQCWKLLSHCSPPGSQFSQSITRILISYDLKQLFFYIDTFQIFNPGIIDSPTSIFHITLVRIISVHNFTSVTRTRRESSHTIKPYFNDRCDKVCCVAFNWRESFVLSVLYMKYCFLIGFSILKWVFKLKSRLICASVKMNAFLLYPDYQYFRIKKNLIWIS